MKPIGITVELGQRILLLSSRPGRVIETWDVDIPGPRVLESPPVAALSAQITDRLRRETGRHAA